MDILGYQNIILQYILSYLLYLSSLCMLKMKFICSLDMNSRAYETKISDIHF